MDNKDAFDLWWEWAEKPLNSPLTIDATIHEAVMALPPDKRRDRAKQKPSGRLTGRWRRKSCGSYLVTTAIDTIQVRVGSSLSGVPAKETCADRRQSTLSRLHRAELATSIDKMPSGALDPRDQIRRLPRDAAVKASPAAAMTGQAALERSPPNAL